MLSQNLEKVQSVKLHIKLFCFQRRKEVGILISIAEKSSINKDFRKLKYRGKFLPGSQKVFLHTVW